MSLTGDRGAFYKDDLIQQGGASLKRKREGREG